MAKKVTTSRATESGKVARESGTASVVASATAPKRASTQTEAEAGPAAQVHASAPAPAAGPSVPPAAASKKRVLDVFYIDSGWNNPVCAAVRENLPAMAEYLHEHRFFVMSPQQSMEFIRRHPGLIGEDPIVLVLDRTAAGEKTPNRSCGFRLSLGCVKSPESAVAMLKWAVQLTVTANTAEMADIISKSAHRETVQGVIELMGEGSSHLIEFAPI